MGIKSLLWFAGQRLTFFFCVGLPQVSAVAGPSQCQSVESLKNFNQVTLTRIPLSPEKWRDELNHLKANERDMVQADVVEVIGFSQDSKIAVRQQNDRNECGDCGIIFVQDLVDDRKLIEIEYTVSAVGSGNYLQRITSQEKAKPFQETSLVKALKQHHIYVNCPLKFEAFDGPGSELKFKDNKVIFGRQGRGRNIGALPDLPGGTIAPKALGWVLSPFEKRAMVFIGFQTRGWEDSFLSLISARGYGALF